MNRVKSKLFVGVFVALTIVGTPAQAGAVDNPDIRPIVRQIGSLVGSGIDTLQRLTGELQPCI